jgi:predicted helicase
LQKNAVAHELEGVIATLVQGYGSTVDDFLRPLDRFYKALEMAAGATDDFSQKQTFLNHVYEKFFQGFAIKVADTHGIVYTPQPIVDFMVESVEAALEKDFGKSLADTGIHILDPFVGTGNYILRIMREIHEHNPSALRHKYMHELHCNEVMLMPYYIACLNIEHLYFELTGEYEAFPGICLVDTFELVEDRQMGMFTSDNTERVQRQKEAPIYVVIGNPPYNAGQVNENDNNKNRKYIAMDKRVQETYVKDSKATYRADLNDPYVKAFRMASDKITRNGEGILCFVTNNGFLDGIAFDGMRKHLYSDFNAVRMMDLKGNIRKDSMRDGIPLGEEHTVFGLGAMVGIAITLCEKRKDHSEHLLEYWDVNFRAKRKEKFELLEQAHDWFGLESKQLEPTNKHLWLTDGMADDWDDLIPLGSKEAKSGKGDALFNIYSLGILTNRDRWVYRFNKSNLVRSMSEMSDFYNDFVAKWPYYESKKDINDFVEYDDAKISWSRDLKLKVKRSRMSTHKDSFVRTSVYRPFCKQHLCFNPIFVDQALKFPRIFPLPETENVVICVSGIGSSKPFQTLASNSIPCLDILEKTQCFPFYVYDEEGNNKKDNITDWGLEQFRNHYTDLSIEKIDVYHYVYGILHDLAYREKYAANLKRELPRIPFRSDFWTYAEAGKKLMDIHIKYEDQDKYPITEEWSLPKNYVHPHGIAVNTIEQVPLQERYYVSKMKRDKNDPTKLIYNDFLTISGIPSEVDEYKLGNRSALNWIIDQYQVSKDKRSGIINNPNDWSYESGNPRYIVDLIKRIITVSMQTNAIVNGLPGE